MHPKLTIVQPSHYRSKTNLTPFKIKKRRVIGLTLPYLAALIPAEWDIKLVDEQLQDIDFAAHTDVAAITTWTINSLRAYEIADEFRQRGVTVIMGGPHTYFYSDECAEHADAVGMGEGETILPLMLDDFLRGRLKKLYHASHLPDLSGFALPRYDLLDNSRHGMLAAFTVQASRGCPFKCEFCSERFHLGYRYRFRPVTDIVEEVRTSGARYVFFADSNFAGHPVHTMELMEALIPLNVRWSALWPAYLCRDRKLMDLAVESGLLHLNMGMESIDQETMSGMGKTKNKVDEYEDLLADLRRRGISYSLNFIFGWDTERPGIFASTLSFLKQQKVPAAYFNILTPHKGTPLYDQMNADRRIIDVENIGRWPGIHCHIQPRYCSPQELEVKVKRLYYEFYGYSSMVNRLPLPLTQSGLASWIINLSQRKVSRASREMENFDNF